MTHTGGLPPDWPDDESRGPFLTAGDAVSAIATLTPELGSSEAFAYSNLGYVLLGAVLETVSGMPYPEFVEQRLVRPAGLKHTRVASGTDEGVVQIRWSAYPAPILDPELGPWGFWGAGGMVGTPADLDRWYRALRRGSVLPPTQAERLWTAHTDGYGYGWHLVRRDDRNVIVHHGGIGYGHKAVYRHYPQSGIRMAIATNLDIQDVGVHDDVLNNLIDIFRGETFPLPPSATSTTPPMSDLVFTSGADTIRVVEHPQGGWAVVPVGIGAAADVWGFTPGGRTEDAIAASRSLLTAENDCSGGTRWIGPQFLAAEFSAAWCRITSRAAEDTTWEVASVRPLSWSTNRTVVHIRLGFGSAREVAWLSLLWEGDRLVEGWTGPESVDPRLTRVVPSAPGRLEVFDWFRYKSDTLSLDSSLEAGWLEASGRRYSRAHGRVSE